MTMYARTPGTTLGRAASLVSLLSMLPVACVTVIGLVVTSWAAESLRQHPDAVGMVSSDFGQWAPLLWGAVALGIPAAAIALGLGLTAQRRPGDPQLAQVGTVLAVVMLVLGLVGFGVFVASVASI